MGTDETPSIGKPGLRPNLNAAEIIRELSRLKPPEGHGVDIPSWPGNLERWAAVPLMAATLLFLALCALALFKGNTPLSPPMQALVQGTVGCSSLLALVSLAMQTAGGTAGVWIAQRKGGEIRAWRCARDMHFGAELACQKAQELDLADKWLEKETRRIEARLAFFFGSADKVALLALVGAGWAAWKDVLGSALSSSGSAIWFGLAFLSGVALGGLALRRSLNELMYQRDLISLATQKRLQ